MCRGSACLLKSKVPSRSGSGTKRGVSMRASRSPLRRSASSRRTSRSGRGLRIEASCFKDHGAAPSLKSRPQHDQMTDETSQVSLLDGRDDLCVIHQDGRSPSWSAAICRSMMRWLSSLVSFRQHAVNVLIRCGSARRERGIPSHARSLMLKRSARRLALSIHPVRMTWPLHLGDGLVAHRGAVARRAVRPTR